MNGVTRFFQRRKGRFYLLLSKVKGKVYSLFLREKGKVLLASFK
jgi:hypothetical protein